jgi:hypothetical protein
VFLAKLLREVKIAQLGIQKARAVRSDLLAKTHGRFPENARKTNKATLAMKHPSEMKGIFRRWWISK